MAPTFAKEKKFNSTHLLKKLAQIIGFASVDARIVFSQINWYFFKIRKKMKYNLQF